MNQFHALSTLNVSSRPASAPCVRSLGGDCLLDWSGFCGRVALLRSWLAGRPERRWIIHTQDTGLFQVAVLALLQSGREAVIPGSLQPGLVAAIRGDDPAGAGTGLLCDEDAAGAIDLRRLPAAAAAAGPGAAGEDFPAIDPARARLTLYTSGSTGQPKAVPKRLEQVEAELANLGRHWGPALAGAAVWSTVSHQHFYGMLFQAFLPLCLGLPVGAERISYPETFAGLAGSAVAVVCSPAFLKRLAETDALSCRFAQAPVLFSSGGVLPSETARHVRELTGAGINEIYGSTETGGIGWRLSPGMAGWQGFPGNEVRIAADGVIEFRSPYLFDPGFYRTGDQGRIDPELGLLLEGRVDTIVKIEEKRVALNEVENRLRESPLVAEAAILALEHGRQFLAAVVVPSAAGRERFAGLSKHDCNLLLREWLHQWFEATVLPRKWRFVGAIPLNTQGKRDRHALEALFIGESGTHPISGPAGPTEPVIRAVRHEGNKVGLDLCFPPESLWFDGHFPGFAILPAVVQVDWLMTCAERYLGVRRGLLRIPRIKFMKPIRPDLAVTLELDWDPAKSALGYSYRGTAGGEVYSSGRLNLEPDPAAAGPRREGTA